MSDVHHSSTVDVQDSHDRYTRSNPPPDYEAALVRADLLSEQIPLIEAQLEFEEVEAFVSGDDYRAWRKSAMHALGFKKSEAAFLKKWLQSNRILAIESGIAADIEKLIAAYTPVFNYEYLPTDNEVALDRLSALKVIFRGIADMHKKNNDLRKSNDVSKKFHALLKAKLIEFHHRVATERDAIQSYYVNDSIEVISDDLFVRIQADYSPMYSPEHEPENVEIARARFQEVKEVTDRLKGLFIVLKEQGKKLDLTAREMRASRGPVVAFQRQIESELQYLKKFIRDASPNTIETFLKALERAVSEGFVLTEIESRVYHEMREQFGLDSNDQESKTP